MAKNAKAKQLTKALLPDPPRCVVCGKHTTETCPGCSEYVHRGCQPRHDCKSGY